MKRQFLFIIAAVALGSCGSNNASKTKQAADTVQTKTTIEATRPVTIESEIEDCNKLINKYETEIAKASANEIDTVIAMQKKGADLNEKISALRDKSATFSEGQLDKFNQMQEKFSGVLMEAAKKGFQ